MNRFFAAYFANLMTLLTGAVILIWIGATQADAQSIPCAETGVIEHQIEDDYGETLRASEAAPVPGGVAHLWTNGATGSYTMLITPEPGVTCIIGVGQSDSLKEQAA